MKYILDTLKHVFIKSERILYLEAFTIPQKPLPFLLSPELSDLHHLFCPLCYCWRLCLKHQDLSGAINQITQSSQLKLQWQSSNCNNQIIVLPKAVSFSLCVIIVAFLSGFDNVTNTPN